MVDKKKNSQKTNKLLLKSGISIATIVILFAVIPAIIKRTSCDIKSTEITADILNLLSNIAIITLPFVYVVLSGKFMKGFLFSWFLQVLLAVSFVHYGVILTTFYKAKQIEGIRALDYYPDAPDIPITIMAGWVPALILCGIAYGIHYLLKKIGLLKKLHDQ